MREEERKEVGREYCTTVHVVTQMKVSLYICLLDLSVYA